MRIPLKARVYSGLLCRSLILIVGFGDLSASAQVSITAAHSPDTFSIARSVPASLAQYMPATAHNSLAVGVAATATGAGTGLSAFYCYTNTPPKGAGTDICTVKVPSGSSGGAVSVSVTSSNAAVTVPATVAVQANATAAQFTANISSVSTTQPVTLTATSGGSSLSVSLHLSAATSTLSINTTSLVFEDVVLNTPDTQPVTLTSTGTEPVTVKAAALTGTGFTLSGATFPLTLNPSQTAILSVQFRPTTAGPATGQLTVSGNSTTGGATVINLSGTGTVPALSAFYCYTNTPPKGPGTDICTVKLPSGSSSGAVSVSVTSSNAAVTVPATVAVQAKATAAQFTANISPVSAAQPVTLTATSGASSLSVPLHLSAGTAGSFSYTGSPIENTLVPATPSTAISNKFFGLTIANLAPNSNYFTPNMTPFPPFPVSTLRLWDVTYWEMIDNDQGENNWTKMDNSIAIAQQNGVSDFIFTFGRVPPWASTSPNDPCATGEGAGTCTFPNMSAFDEFATQVVQRYCGKVKYYETWNEPDNPQFWDGTNAQMLTIAQNVYQIVKDPANCGCANGSCSPNGGANPNKVLMPPVSGVGPAQIAWLKAYLADAAAPYPYADIATFHGYSYPGNPPEGFVAGVQLLKQTLATNGLSDLDLWNTEASWKSNSSYDEDQQASWLMRYHALQAALSISRFVWYSYEGCSWGTLWSSPLCTGNQGPTGQLTEAGNAYSTIESWFVGANLTHCQQYQNGLWACELQRVGNYDAWMLWSSTGTSIPVSIPANFGLTVYRDWQNNVTTLPTQITVGQMPVLLENKDL